MKRFFSTIVLAATFAALTQAQTTYKEWIAAGEKDMEAGKYSTAIGAYTKAIQESPANSDAFMQRAIAKTKNGDDDGAAIDFTNVIRSQPNNAQAYALRSETKVRRNDAQAALFDINQAIKINPSSVDYLQQRSKISDKMGLSAQAQADLDLIKKIKTDGDFYVSIEPTKITKDTVPSPEKLKSTRRQKEDAQSGPKREDDDDEIVITKNNTPKVEKRREQRKTELKIEEKSANNYNQPEVVIPKETPKTKTSKPKKEKPAPIVVKEVPKPAPIVVKEVPKPEPIVVKEVPKPEPIVLKEVPKPEPIVVKEASKTLKDDDVIIVDGVKQYRNGTVIGAVELQPTGGMGLQKQVVGGQPQADFRAKAQPKQQIEEQPNEPTSKLQSPKNQTRTETNKTSVFVPTPAKNSASTVASAAIAAQPSTQQQLSDKSIVPQAPAAEVQRSMFLEARRMARANNHKGAIEQLTKLIEQDPTNAASFLNRAISRGIMEDFNGAMEDFDMAAKITPTMPEIYYNKANLFFDSKRYIEAIDDYTKAIENNKIYTQAYLNRALAKRAVGGAYDPCADWKTAADLGSPKAKKMLAAFCDDFPEEHATTDK